MAAVSAANQGAWQKRLYNELSFLFGAGSFRAAVSAGKFLDPARGIDKLLFASEKRMAGGADADFNIPAGRAGVINRATGAANVRLVIIRMDVRFHVGKECGR